MAKVDFFTPIIDSAGLQERKSPILASMAADMLFYWGGKIAHVTPESLLSSKKADVILRDQKTTHLWWFTLIKVVAYATVIIPLIALAIKAIVRWTHDFQVLDGIEWGKAAAARDLQIPEGFQEQLEQVIDDAIEGRDSDQIVWHRNRRIGEKVFRLKGFESVICKMYPERGVDVHFDNIARTKAACLTEHSSHIRIPHTQKMRVGTVDVLVQEYISESAPTLKDYAKSFLVPEQSIRQLTHLIAVTGLRKIHPHNLRILDGHIYRLDFKRIDEENRGSVMKNTLFDHAYAHDSMNGLVLNFSHPLQVRAVIGQAVNDGILSGEEAREIEEWQAKRAQCENWYHRTGIKPDSPVQVNFDSLDIGDLEQIVLKSEKMSLREAVKFILREINATIQVRTKHTKDAMIGRYIVVNTKREDIFAQLSNCKEGEASPLEKILDAMKQQEAIFNFTFFNAAVEIQA